MCLHSSYCYSIWFVTYFLELKNCNNEKFIKGVNEMNTLLLFADAALQYYRGKQTGLWGLVGLH